MSTSVFVFGAGGYIGEGVAYGFRRAGFRVFGLIRSEAKAKLLGKNEIIPIVGTQEKFDDYKDILLGCSVIVDAIGHNDESVKFLQRLVDLFSHRSDYAANYKPLFLFTSGIMTYGNAASRLKVKVVDETIVPSPTADETKKRFQLENKILSITKLRTVVVRPGFVYGGHGGAIASLFFNPAEGAMTLYGSLEKRWSWVHLDDLSDGYVRIANSGFSGDNQMHLVMLIYVKQWQKQQELKMRT
eukprot:TRINITY_DN1640_c0_g1_i1.p1 TRINITY_DN1640_c0_g1~~TRINITY_DN1640_c0_g1_i1.p1  ORF type:complete len:243 (-),score=13.32 TRINITY_DN1640_c0_g1_i1:346-1074(-)